MLADAIQPALRVLPSRVAPACAQRTASTGLDDEGSVVRESATRSRSQPRPGVPNRPNSPPRSHGAPSHEKQAPGVRQTVKTTGYGVQ